MESSFCEDFFEGLPEIFSAAPSAVFCAVFCVAFCVILFARFSANRSYSGAFTGFLAVVFAGVFFSDGSSKALIKRSSRSSESSLITCLARLDWVERRTLIEELNSDSSWSSKRSSSRSARVFSGRAA